MACRHLYLVEGDLVGSATPLLTHIVRRFQEHPDALPVLFIAARQPPAVWALHLRRLGVPVQTLFQGKRLHLLDYASLLQHEGSISCPGGLVVPQACASAQRMLYRAAAGLTDSEKGLLVVVDDIQQCTVLGLVAREGDSAQEPWQEDLATAATVTVHVTARHAPGLAVRTLEVESVARREGPDTMRAALGPELGCATTMGDTAHATLVLQDNGALARSR